MVIDGAMGTAIQRDRPDEAGYRGERFKDWASPVQGNNDLLNLTQPQIIEGIHREYPRRAQTSWRPTRSTPTRSHSPTTAWRNWATS